MTLGALLLQFARGVLALRAAPPRALVWATTIDPNRAGLAELAALPGIGPLRARAIVLHRIRYGPFRAVTDLVAVDGLGVETVRGLAHFLTVRSPSSPP